MERILIDRQVMAYAQQYERDFRAYGYDVPGKLRALKNDLAALNIHNHLTAVELAQYQGYLEEVASDYDNANPAKNLLVLVPNEFQNYSIAIMRDMLGAILWFLWRKTLCIELKLEGEILDAS